MVNLPRAVRMTYPPRINAARIFRCALSVSIIIVSIFFAGVLLLPIRSLRASISRACANGSVLENPDVVPAGAADDTFGKLDDATGAIMTG